MTALAQSYGLAVTISCSIAVGAGKLPNPDPNPHPKQACIGRSVNALKLML